MNRKRIRKLQASFAKRGGMFWASPDAPPEVTALFLEELLECPECRAAVIEACNSDDRKNVDIDEVIRNLRARGDH